ncbi:transposase [Leptospira kobayashii]|uniref:Transposase n=1 Tax=Leptospira kobayashii TaxID=1917830 RepID=A0ABM7UIL3_9LEPT|nr:transposase [Leptospira kobayashii]BDA78593.1 transposase [Leptospira kobayashii]
MSGIKHLKIGLPLEPTAKQRAGVKMTRSLSPSHTFPPNSTSEADPLLTQGVTSSSRSASPHSAEGKLHPKSLKEENPSTLISHFINTKTFRNSYDYKNPLLMNEEVNRHYKIKSLTILAKLFNKNCDCNEPSLVFLKVKNRDTVGRCSNCQKQVSITSKTPFDNFKLPLSYFSYILHDQILQYPKVVTSTEISRKLNLPYKTAYYLKRRIQVVTSLLNETLQKQLYNELEEYGNKNPIKLPKSGDLRPLIANKPVAVADSVVLYSSSLRANKHRSRRYKTGTSSIYLSNSLGGEQKGILVHTVGVNHGMTFYKSIPLNNQSYLLQDLNSKIPQAIPLFTDEGYTFIWDRPNHRMVNHSKKSSDHRYNLSRERWITKDGVSSNGAEARNNTLKQSFRSYHYISPKWSQLYLDEISFLGNLRYSEGLKKLLLDDTDVGLGDRD